MKNIIFFSLLSGLIFSCSSTSRSIFSKKTPHEKYAEKIDDADLEDTPAGKQWLAASKMALENSQLIQLPFRLQGYFAPDKPRAIGLKFKANRGEKITFSLNKKSPFVIYSDVFKLQGNEPDLMLSADTAIIQFSFDVDEASLFVLRLQPELFRSGEYSLSASVGPSLDFPIPGNKGKVGSFWGDSRDGGKRNHEGIDIFAPKRTPVVAAADGVVTAVKEEGIGGKTVWLRTDKNISLYYAHLDKQLVQAGQAVKKGDVLGLVGNTGNAKNTPSHLHFGIYSYSGPMDPFPFINKNIKTATELPGKNLKYPLRLIKDQKGSNGTVVKANTLMQPLAVMAKNYITELPDGKVMQVPMNAVKLITTQVEKKEGLRRTAKR